MNKFADELHDLLYRKGEEERLHIVARINGTRAEWTRYGRAFDRLGKLRDRFLKKYRPEGDL